MDIRVAAYRPVTVTTLSRPGAPLATAVVQNAQNSSPVTQVSGIQQARSSQAFNPAQFATTEVRGTKVNILA